MVMPAVVLYSHLYMPFNSWIFDGDKLHCIRAGYISEANATWLLYVVLISKAGKGTNKLI